MKHGSQKDLSRVFGSAFHQVARFPHLICPVYPPSIVPASILPPHCLNFEYVINEYSAAWAGTRVETIMILVPIHSKIRFIEFHNVIATRFRKEEIIRCCRMQYQL